MKDVTKAMQKMNKQMKLPEIQKIMMEFEKQTELMDMKEEMMSDAIGERLFSIGVFSSIALLGKEDRALDGSLRP